LPGYRNPEGGAAEAEERAAAGRRYCPEAVTEQMAGYRTAGALWTKAPIGFPVAESSRHRRLARAHNSRMKECRPIEDCQLLKYPANVISQSCDESAGALLAQ